MLRVIGNVGNQHLTNLAGLNWKLVYAYMSHVQEISISLIAKFEQLVSLLLLLLLVGNQGLEVLFDQILPELHFHTGKVVDLTGAEIPVLNPIWVDYDIAGLGTDIPFSEVR